MKTEPSISTPTLEQFREQVTDAARAPLLARIAELEKDAARYRWLRSQPKDCTAPRIDICEWSWDGYDSVNTGEGLRGDEADAAIDAAMMKEAT